jgi:two-component system, sporulation sensor kinase B
MLILFAKGMWRQINQKVITFIVEYLVFEVLAVWLVIFSIENMLEKTKLHREKIQRDEMLKSVAEMAASVTHEVRNPMTVIRDFLQLLQEDGSIPDTKKVYINISIEELDRAQQIINEYFLWLKFKRIQ